MKKTLFFALFALILSTSTVSAINTDKAPAPVQKKEMALPAHATIYISSKYALQLIEVYDEQGNLYEKVPLQATTWYALDIRKWPLGIYSIKVENNVSSVTKKILKVR